jgi:uncharacterized surface protein with fasciclin (FAS1) repeats
MRIRESGLRWVCAFTIIALISSQVPSRNTAAMAADCYGGCPACGDCPDGGGGGGGRTLLQVTALALAGYGVYAVVQASNKAPVPPPQTPPNSTPATVAAATPGDPIWDTANKSEDLNQFARLAEVAGMKEMLRTDSPLTVFVPTNNALATMDQARLTDLLKPENRERLSALVQLHIVPGRFTIEQLVVGAEKAGVDGMKLTTRSGGTLTITTQSGQLSLNGVPVTLSDIECANGVIHPLQAVLTPPEPQQ